MDVDALQRERAIERLKQLAGVTQADAEALVDAALAGAVDHAFELINGSGAVPTAMTTSKADQLRWICDRAGRLVSQREVEIVFRVTSAAARSILNTMLATYEESLRGRFLERMRGDVTVLPTGTQDTALTWTLRFTEPSMFEAAWSELSRLGVLGQCEGNLAQRKIVIPRTVTVDSGSIAMLGLLGIEADDK